MSVIKRPEGLLEDFLNYRISPEDVRFVGKKPLIQKKPQPTVKKANPRFPHNSTKSPTSVPLCFNEEGHLVPVSMSELPPEVREILDAYRNDPTGNTLIEKFPEIRSLPSRHLSLPGKDGACITAKLRVFTIPNKGK